jgi:arylsulfatase
MNMDKVFCGLFVLCTLPLKAADSPNVILIITDDQGYGDLGINGNHHIRTPVLDKFTSESIRFNNFYVCPVSAPTRSSLLTGRYSLRTGIRDTYNGGALMATDEITIAEILKQAEYQTGIFGKWHLGDNYPSRPCDQGFDESVVHLGGGMGQPCDITTYFRGDSSYFDPVLWHNGRQEKYTGYCSDIFASEAIRFIEKNYDRPFFCYLAFNAPHTPLQVPEKYYHLYQKTDPSDGFMDNLNPFPKMNENNKEDARKVYAMVSNIDDNVGKLLNKLDELGISDNTVVIFMTDNGPQQRRYVAGMRGLKGSVYSGGIRVPFCLRYPALKKKNMDIKVAAAHIDILPTIANICNAKIPRDRKIDGVNLMPFITGGEKKITERSLFFYWTRHSPELYNNIALLKGRYKLVGNTDIDSSAESFELYDIENDPGEKKNLVNEKNALAENLRTELEITLRELVSSENMVNQPRIEIGSVHENPVILNRNDAGGQWGIGQQEEAFGQWRVKIREGRYNFRFRFIKAVPAGGRMMVETMSFISQSRNETSGLDILEMNNVYLPAMKCNFVPFYQAGSRRILPLWVEIEKID